ncbi:MAG: hypothetical protein IJQ62_08280 [Clostridia bacterium]|nr:hypothetical protein [Clostridia bacterium]
MNGKKCIALLLALCLTVSAVPALAAPARELQAFEAAADEKLQTLVRIAVAAIPEECYGMDACEVINKDQAPGAALTAQALWAAVLLTRETTWISDGEAKQLYQQIFTNGTCDPAALTGDPFVAAKNGGLEMNPAVRDIAMDGAYLYAAEFDGTDLLVRCDLYYTEEEGADVETAPELLLTWTNHAVLSLRPAPETEFGYTVNAISLSPCYRDGNFGEWTEVENEELEYELQVPGSLELADETPDHWVFTNIEGDVTLTIDAKEENLSYDQAMADFLEAHPGKTVKPEPLYDAFTLMNAGEFIMVVTADDFPWTYTVTLTFPRDRQAEYEFYAEIIRNAFIVWGLSHG